MLTFADAREQLLAAACPVQDICQLPISAVLGRVLAADQVSAIAVPPQNNSVMDGYAIAFSALRQTSRAPGDAGHDALLPEFPVVQRVPAGKQPTPLASGSAARIFTGALMPAGADTVVMQEHCETRVDDAGQTWVRLLRLPQQAGEQVRLAGADIALGQTILTAGQRLRPQDIALAAAAGITHLPVYRRLRVGVFFTGDELTPPGATLKPGHIYNANRFALCGLLESLGCEVQDLGEVADSLPCTRQALQEAARGNDLVITSGGVSVGEEDHVKTAVAQLGSLRLWNVAVKPGKPLVFGAIHRAPDKHEQAWFLGLPGNPVAAMVDFMMFARPFILRLQGAAQVLPRPYSMRADFDWLISHARLQFLRCKINAQGGLDIYPQQDSALVTSLVWGDGLVMNPPNREIHCGEYVSFIPFTELLF